MVFILIGCLLAFLNVSQFAQTQTKVPRPERHVSDFARVLDLNTADRLENTLQNLKSRSKIDFYVAVVENTGDKDLSDFSGQLSSQWNLGAFTSRSKSLLLVVSVATKEAFTRFSRLVQRDLPEDVLGAMTQRMRVPLDAGDFSTAVDNGVNVFIGAMAKKIGFSLEDIDKPAIAVNSNPAAPQTTAIQTSTSDQQTRPRKVSVPAPSPPSDETKTKATADNKEPVTSEEKPKSDDTKIKATADNKEPVTSEEKPKSDDTKIKTTADNKEPVTSEEKPKTAASRRASSKNTSARSVVKQTTPEEDADELEEVELTLTLPLAKRATKLKEFLDTHPHSKARPRAKELLISTHAGLGDEKLKNGDPAGVDELLLAIDEADSSVSDQLFTGVISQIPMNLYLRKEYPAAFKAAQNIESKFATDPKRLVSVAGFYLAIERGDEAARVAELAINLAPEMAEAHRIRAFGFHLSLRLDEAINEYKRVLELDPNSRGARGSLADLYRSTGKPEEALALYIEQLNAEPKDRAARAGIVLSLFELGRKDEAMASLEATEADDAKNLPLLTGAAYWFAAHENYEKALELATKAVAVEPRYTWAQIAAARSLIALKRPLEAERAMRYARQYGKFPTLNYELANVLASMGLYEEAVEVLRESFGIADGQIETRLAGRFPAKHENFLELLAPERRASIYQLQPADSAANAKILKDLLVFSNLITPPAEGPKPDEALVVAAALEFASGSDNRRAFRQVYAASRLLRNGIGFQAAFELADEAKKASASAMDIPVVTLAVQADEYRELRARAIAAGNVPDLADAPRDVLERILHGRSEDLMGWALFNQEKYPQALDHLKRAAELLPSGTPAWRAATWHLGVAQQQTGNDTEALENFVRSYKAGEPDSVRRGTIEQLYKKINGSLDGLEEKIGHPVTTSAAVSTEPQTTPSKPESATPGESASPSPSPEKSPQPETSTGDATKQKEPTSPASGDSKTVPVPEASPAATPTPNAETPGAPTTDSQAVKTGPGASDESLKAASARLRSIIKISGRAIDANNNGIPNVVVVLISPSGSVIAATTDTNGYYSFTVPPSEKAYRLIPSKDGLTFAPIDRSFANLFDDKKSIDFVGTSSRP
jgi:tetratricopeptide (TPR) repeat protein